MSLTGATSVQEKWDKGQVLELLGTGITTAYQYTEVVADGTSPTKFPPLQYSGQSRQLSLFVYLKTVGGSPVTAVVVDVEICYGDPTQAVNWMQVLSKVHQGAGAINVDSVCTFGAAAKEGQVLVTCAELQMAKHVRVGAKANAAGIDGDIVRINAGAW